MASVPGSNGSGRGAIECRERPLGVPRIMPGDRTFTCCLTCGAFTRQGEFLELPELDLERLQAAWQEAVFALYLAEDKIEPEVVENMRTWPHSGFSVDQSVTAGRRPGGHRASGRVHDALSVQPLAAGQGDPDRAGGLQGREGRLPGLPRPAGRRTGTGHPAEFPDPRPAGIPGRVQPSTFRRRART